MGGGVTHELAGLTDWSSVFTVCVRLVLAMAAGGLLGYQRRRQGKPAGTRTHMLVALGAALFVITMSANGGTSADLSRVIQGITTGIGFIGAGAIIKLEQDKEVLGLTTAADIWLTTALGVAAGTGHPELVILGTAFALFILAILARFEGAEDDQPKKANRS